MLTLGTIIKSPSDNRTYKAIRLQNQLECVLIQDLEALKSSAALSMGVGSFKDPITSQGLAHYLEHMLFMGTTKYPDENEYSNFITKNGGSNNAYTSQEETNYMFEVSSTAFEPALDRFAQFFVSPLIKQQSAEKQLEAVHSEHQKNILNDSWRKYQLSKYIAKQGHPFNKFSTGDKGSLTSQNLQEVLHTFYRENYSANLMKLVVYGKEEIQILQKWVVQKFSQIPNKKLSRFQLSQHPFDKKAFGKLFKIVPVKDFKKLELTWILPNKTQHYKNHPGSYVSNLIGHEGKGSILSYLIKEGLGTSLSSGNYDSYNCYTEFSINIDLTEKGLQKVNDIIGYILYYINMLKKQTSAWIFDELKLIKKLKFEYLDKKKGMSETSRIAKYMHERKIQELIIYPYLMEEWKPELINQFLSEMTLENLIVMVQAKQFELECTQEQPIYKSKFIGLELGKIQPLQCDVSLPEKNIFLPKDLSILPLETERQPSLIYKSEFLDTYYKQDHRFGLPKANINLRINFLGNFSVIQDIGRSLLLDMLKEHLRQFSYLAELAQIEVEPTFVSYFSLDIKFKGFSDSLKVFIVEYLRRLFEFVPSDQQLFSNLIEKHRRKYANNLLNDPYQIAYNKNAVSLRNNSANPDTLKLIQIENLTLEEVGRLSKAWKKQIYIESYFSGNITEQISRQISLEIQKFLTTHSKPLHKQHTGQIRSVILNPNQTLIVQQQLENKNEQNSAVVVFFQTGQLTPKTQLLLKLTQSIAKQPAFDYLRTKEQLGYIVFCVAEDHRGVGGLSLIVQSSVKTSYELITYIDKFVNEKLKQLINNLTQEEFDTYKNSLKNVKEEKDKNLAAETLRFWNQIVKHKYLFERKQVQLKTLSFIQLAELKEFVNQKIFIEPRRSEIHVTSAKKQAQNSAAKLARQQQKGNIKIYDSPEKFQRAVSLYPDFYAPV